MAQAQPDGGRICSEGRHSPARPPPATEPPPCRAAHHLARVKTSARGRGVLAPASGVRAPRMGVGAQPRRRHVGCPPAAPASPSPRHPLRVPTCAPSSSAASQLLELHRPVGRGDVRRLLRGLRVRPAVHVVA
ncbi:hypothetical protein ACP4OV_022523 [Aristida adscensionis]